VALFQVAEDFLHFLEFLLVHFLTHALEVDRYELEVAFVQDFIVESIEEFTVGCRVDSVIKEKLLLLRNGLDIPIKQKVLYDVIDLEVEFRNGMLEGLLDVPYIFLEQFGQNGQVPVSESDLIDIGILLAEDSHQFINIGQDKLVFVLTHQRLLLKRTV
jgi:hypothetical protein